MIIIIGLPLCLELMTDSVSVPVVYSSAILLLWAGLYNTIEVN